MRLVTVGNWGRLENLIFTNWEVRDIATSYGAYDQVLHGLDFGFNHPSAFLTVGLKDDELYIFDEVYERGLTNNELIKQVNIHAIRNHVITADSAEPARIEEFRQAGLLINPDLARALEDVGVAAIFVHGRTREQGFSGAVNLAGIRAVVSALKRVPVIGNGDVTTPQAAKMMLDQTGCAGVSVPPPTMYSLALGYLLITSLKA